MRLKAQKQTIGNNLYLGLSFDCYAILCNVEQHLRSDNYAVFFSLNFASGLEYMGLKKQKVVINISFFKRRIWHRLISVSTEAKAEALPSVNEEFPPLLRLVCFSSHSSLDCKKEF